MPMKWYGPLVTAKVQRMVGARIDAAARHLARRARESVSVPGPTKSNRGAPASEPGKFPHKRLGVLRSRITSEYDATSQTARVGTNYKVGKFLELGTRRMLRRPWLTLALLKFKSEIRRILQHGKVAP